jgi:arginine decarboxylase
VLVLFSVGTSKGKWGTLIEALLEFKRLYDGCASVAEVLPELAEKYPDRYGWDSDGQPIMTLKELCQDMHSAMCDLKLPGLLNEACDDIPPAEYSSAETYQMLVRYRTEKILVTEMAKEPRVAGHMLVPYPPGIPILMPGELLKENGPQVKFLLALEKFNRLFPGFEREIHGIETDDEGRFWMRCVVKEPEKALSEDRGLLAAAPALKPKMRLRSMARSTKRGRS